MLDFTNFGLRQTGVMPSRNSKEIAASFCGVGCECLDRDYFDPKPVFPQLGEIGIKWVRLQTGWIKCEKSPGVYDFGWLDWQVDTLLAAGIQPWFNLCYGNPLYTPGAGPTAEKAVGQVPLNTPEALTAWLNFTKALAKHFKGRVQVYEIWNEPNHPLFWVNLPITGKNYARLFDPTQQAIRDVLPEARIVALAATSGIFSVAGMNYVKEFFSSLQDPMAVDIVTFHSYRYPPDNRYAEDVNWLRSVVEEFNPAIELWQGESGYASEPNGTGSEANHNYTSEIIQAKWMTRHVLCNLGLGLRHVSWHQAIDLAGYREPDKINPKGLLRTPDATRKPSFYVYQRLCALFTADVQPCVRRWRAQVQTSTMDYLMPSVQAYHFTNTDGMHYLTYWRDGDIHNHNVMEEVELWVEGQCHFTRLLDPYTGYSYTAQGETDGSGTRFRLPLTDYALILTT
jgi:hypothetical protein